MTDSNFKNSAKKVLKSGLCVGAKNFIIPAVDILVAERPEFLPSWLIVRGFFGSLFDVQQEKINEFVDFIKKNGKVFTKEIVETAEFQEGFVLTFEEYLKQRSEKKRKTIQNIFLGFTKAGDKENFAIEIMYDLLNKLTPIHTHLLSGLEKKPEVIKSDERDSEDSFYDLFKYIEYLGLIVCQKEQQIESYIIDDSEITTSGLEDVVLEEKETFSLSSLGEEFVKFIKL